MYKSLPSNIIYIENLELEKYISLSTMTIYEAMDKLNNTFELFQIIVDGNNRFVGTLTDGDIRRGLLSGYKLDDSVKKCMKSKPLSGKIKNEAEKAEIKKAYQIDMDRMRKKAEEAARAASQAPVERKGEVREELLEEYLEKEFPTDKFEAVKKGQKGGDIIQSVIIKGESVGSILYESKDVLNFDEKWVQKLLNDMSKVDATVGFIFTKVMPKKSKGFVEEREGGRVIICSEYPILRQLVSTTRKLIQANKANIASNKDEISPKLKDLFNYLNSNEFRIQTRKIFNGIKKDGEQIDKDERSIENQIKNRRKNLEDSKKNINSIITSLVSNAGLSDDILDGDDDDLLLE